MCRRRRLLCLGPVLTSHVYRDPLVGRVFNGRYRVTERVARGGMGKVYKAIQDPLDRIVALKVLDPTFTGEVGTTFTKVFLEASICARLSHPNTVTILITAKPKTTFTTSSWNFLKAELCTKK